MDSGPASAAIIRSAEPSRSSCSESPNNRRKLFRIGGARPFAGKTASREKLNVTSTTTSRFSPSQLLKLPTTDRVSGVSRKLSVPKNFPDSGVYVGDPLEDPIDPFSDTQSNISTNAAAMKNSSKSFDDGLDYIENEKERVKLGYCPPSTPRTNRDEPHSTFNFNPFSSCTKFGTDKSKNYNFKGLSPRFTSAPQFKPSDSPTLAYKSNRSKAFQFIPKVASTNYQSSMKIPVQSNRMSKHNSFPQKSGPQAELLPSISISVDRTETDCSSDAASLTTSPGGCHEEANSSNRIRPAPTSSPGSFNSVDLHPHCRERKESGMTDLSLISLNLQTPSASPRSSADGGSNADSGAFLSTSMCTTKGSERLSSSPSGSWGGGFMERKSVSVTDDESSSEATGVPRFTLADCRAGSVNPIESDPPSDDQMTGSLMRSHSSTCVAEGRVEPSIKGPVRKISTPASRFNKLKLTASSVSVSGQPRVQKKISIFGNLADNPIAKKLPFLSKKKSGDDPGSSSSSGAGSSGAQRDDYRQWATSFETLFNSPRGVQLFRLFLQREFSDENIEFWLACEEFKKLKGSKQEQKARDIYTDFVAIQAPREVNLDSTTREQTIDAIKSPTKNTFDQAQARIVALMEKDSYPRFLKSELYLDLTKSVKGD